MVVVKAISPGFDESALCAAVKQIRDASDDPDLTTVTVFSQLQAKEEFKSVTLAQVKKAENKVKLRPDLIANVQSNGDQGDSDDDDSVEEGRVRVDVLPTDAAKCIVSGSGLTVSTVRQAAQFTIQACDSKGKPRTTGGDTFFVAIRGPAVSHARVRDQDDGTYIVAWKPTTSGYYTIYISLSGTSLAGSPYGCHATPTMPCPTACMVRGDHLHNAVSRATHYFEVLFKDKHGQTAHAVDLDVYVEPIPPLSPRNRQAPPTDAERAAADAAIEEEKKEKEPTVTKKKKDRDGKRGASRSAKAAAAAAPPAPLPAAAELPPPTALPDAPITALAPEVTPVDESALAVDYQTKYRMMRVKVGDKPLIVRAGPEKESEQVGRLLPGQIVTIVEERVAEDGEVRACVALDSLSRSVDGVLPTTFRSAVALLRHRSEPGDAVIEVGTPSAGREPANSVGGGTAANGSVHADSGGLSNTPSRADELRGVAPAPSVQSGGGGALEASPLRGEAEADSTPAKRQPQLEAGLQSGQLSGWVTLVKPKGKKMVTSRVKLGPGSRRQYVQQWARRRANDRAAAYKGGSVVNELKADPMGIGFGFGGVEPGILHSRGVLHEVHKVSYTIGLAGQYLLHVRLRQQAVAIPGSPFKLTVSPGAAHAKSTRIALASGPLRGMVGTGPETGCTQELQTADKMGNMCITGGAPVQIVTDSTNQINTEVMDRNDGTYQLLWKSTFSGTFKTRILIDNEDVIGSPIEFTLTSSNPELSKSELDGEGLKTAIAGKEALITIKFVDQFANTAIPGPGFQFGMSVSKEKDKIANVKKHSFRGEWEEGDTGIYRIKYTPTSAGTNEVHVWCDPSGKGERIPFPGSPFHVHVGAGEASASTSQVERNSNGLGWTKIAKEEKNDKYGKSSSLDPNALSAGDTVTIKPQVYDLFGNSTVLPDGALKVIHTLPDGSQTELSYSTLQRGGQTTYDVKHDTTLAGDHSVAILLSGSSIKGSPVEFTVLPDKPDPAFCKLNGPPQEMLYTNVPTKTTLKTFDKFNNECTHGGLILSTRLQVIKQGVHDQTTLVPSNHTNTWEDNGDGTYTVDITLNIPCAIKLFVNMDKNLPAAGGELPSVHMHFHPSPEDGSEPKESKESKETSSPAKSAAPTGAGKQRLKSATNEMMEGFGNPEDRREKDAVLVAAEAFADGAKDFVFDKDPAKNSRAKSASFSSAKRSGSSSFGSAIPTEASEVTPNPHLFDKAAESSGSGAPSSRTLSSRQR